MTKQNQSALSASHIIKKCVLSISLATFALSLFALPAFAAPKNAKRAFTPATVQEIIKVVDGYKGKVVVLSVFASWCPPCKEEAKTFVDFYAKHPSGGNVQLISASLDEESSDLTRFIANRGITYPVYLAKQDFVDYFDIQSIPTILIFDRTGKIVEYSIGIASMDELENLVKKYNK